MTTCHSPAQISINRVPALDPPPPQTAPLSESESLVVQTKGGQKMPRGKKFTAEQIIGKLRKGAELGRQGCGGWGRPLGRCFRTGLLPAWHLWLRTVFEAGVRNLLATDPFQ